MASRAPRGAASLAAYVLHHYDWSESSVILDLFTREHGRLAVAAKGAKRPHSQLRSVLLPFQRINVMLGRTAGDDPQAQDVQVLRSAEWAGGAPMLGGAALFSGFYLNELLMKLLGRHDPHAALFDAYAATLPELVARDELQAQAALRAFELTLLREIGVLPELGVVTLTQEPVDEADRYGLGPESGVIRQAPGAEASFTGASLVALQAALQHGNPAAIQLACRGVLPELKSVLRQWLHYHLGSAGLRTRQVMLDAQKLHLD
jgi:DNA repair protein RecO (recombination protein O)